jgi:cyclophilin family peptidyl-prolyl cis-trans isomerase
MRNQSWLPVAVALLATLGLPAQEKPVSDRDPGLYATLETSMGSIVIYLFEKEAPKTVENFVDLATGKKPWTHPRTGQRMVNKPYFDGLIFHRVIPGFMIQTGDPLGIGTGGPGYTIPDEFDPKLKYDRPGRLGMANIGQPNTGGAQFFITHAPTPHLTGKHTIFAQVIEGQDVVNAIGKVPRDAADKPKNPVTILKVTIERVGAPPAP